MRYGLFFLILLFSCSQKQEGRRTDTSEKQEVATKKKAANGLSYAILRERKNRRLENDTLQKEIDEWLDGNENADLDELTDFLLDMTGRHLAFTFDKCQTEVAALGTEGKTNCIGYAAYFSSLMNYALEKKGWKYDCRHYVGKIYFGKTNINALFKNDPFFKDHDFNVILDRKGVPVIAVDPGLYEYLGWKRIGLRN